MKILNKVGLSHPLSLFNENVFKDLSYKYPIITLIALSIFALFAACRFYYRNGSNGHISSKLPSTLPVVKKKELDLSFANLKKGYAAIPFLEESIVRNCFESLEVFFSSPEGYQKQFTVKNEMEIGFKLHEDKKSYVIRNQEIPKELKLFTSYISKVHDIALNILAEIEKDLNLESGHLTQTVSKTPLPVSDRTASVLRLFSYDPSLKDGVAVAAHEDLGLLTIIPRSQVPALEVWDYSQSGDWINLEEQVNSSEAVVLVGETLSLISKGKYLPATHRVKKNQDRRYSIVYQLRAEPTVLVEYKGKTVIVKDWTQIQRAMRQSVNGSY